MRLVWRLAAVIVFLMITLFYVQQLDALEAAARSLGAGWQWKFLTTNLLLVAGVVILELPRVLTSRGRMAIDWSVLIIYGLPGLFLLLNPFWGYLGLQVSPELLPRLGELQLIGNILLGLGLGKALRLSQYDFYRSRSW